MSEELRIILKPTRWFLLRAGAMLAMFAIFAGWFLFDWKVGYPKKNLIYAVQRSFEQAGQEFTALNAQDGGGLTPSRWEEYAGKQEVKLPEGPGLLPPGTRRPMPWPEVLKDYGRLKDEGWSKLWIEYSGERRWPSAAPEHPADSSNGIAKGSRELREQLVMGSVCGVLALGAAFLLLRTMRRTIEADGEALIAQDRRRIPFSALDRLDKRKWKTKGLAFAYYDDAGTARKVRIDGLTYGGFKKESDEPAERLMERIESHFSGELIDYVEAGEDSAVDEATGDA